MNRFEYAHQDLARRWATECGEFPKIYGVAVSLTTFDEVMAPWEGKMVPMKHWDGINRIAGIPFVCIDGLAADVCFFTDEEVWKHFLQHTDQ